MSGGRATLLHRKGKAAQNSAGDITATGEEGYALTDPFFIECKFYKKLGLEAFAVKNSGPLWNFWRTAIKEAAKHGKAPLLIAKQNGTETFVAVNSIYHIPEPRHQPAVTAFWSLPKQGVHLYWLKELFPLPGTKPTVRKKA
jgi:hypothetical protein